MQSTSKIKKAIGEIKKKMFSNKKRDHTPKTSPKL